MKYKKRLLEPVLTKIKDYFPVIALTGARQVGKSTLLAHLLPEVTSVVFDPVIDVANARQDPELFLNHLPTPAILDEIQYAPELLSVIKRRVDRNPTAGQYWLTGSQNLQLLKSISESLAGRVALFELAPMTLGETQDQASSWFIDYLKDPNDFVKCPRERLVMNCSLYDILWRGGYPGLLGLDDDIGARKLDSYIKTYVERDVRLIAEVSDLQEFHRFIRLIANLSAQEINFSELGREIGVTSQTAKRWLNIFKATYQWNEIEPYFGNSIKRIAGKPKGYFIDTGMACQLRKVSSAAALMGYPGLGALFESHVAQDLLRQISVMNSVPNVYHWRTHGGAEVDLIFEMNDVFYPVEIKCKSQPTKGDLNGIKAFRETYPRLNIAPALVVACCEQKSPLSSDTFAVPFDLR